MTTQQLGKNVQEAVDRINIASPLSAIFSVCPPSPDGKIRVMTSCGDHAELPAYKIANSISWPRADSQDQYVVEDMIGAFEEGFVNKIYRDQLGILVTTAVRVSDLPRFTGGIDAFLVPRDSVIPKRALQVEPGFFDEDDNKRFNVIFTEKGNFNIVSNSSRQVIRIKGFTDDVNDMLEQLDQPALPAKSIALIACDPGAGNNFVFGEFDSLQVFGDPVLRKQMRDGIYGWMEIGIGTNGSIMNPKAILGSMQKPA